MSIYKIISIESENLVAFKFPWFVFQSVLSRKIKKSTFPIFNILKTNHINSQLPVKTAYWVLSGCNSLNVSFNKGPRFGFSGDVNYNNTTIGLNFGFTGDGNP